MMEDKGGTMTTAITNPKKITLEDLEEKLESFIHVFSDDLCRTIIEYMIDSEGPFAITRYKKFDHHGFIRQPEIFLINFGKLIEEENQKLKLKP